MLEFDGQALDPAIVSAQPMKSAQIVCAPGNPNCFFTNFWSFTSGIMLTKLIRIFDMAHV